MITMKDIFDDFANECEDQNKVFAMKAMLKHLCKAFEVENLDEIKSDMFWDISRTLSKHLKSSNVNLTKKSQRE